jgi:hypothetical protein
MPARTTAAAAIAALPVAATATVHVAVGGKDNLMGGGCRSVCDRRGWCASDRGYGNSGYEYGSSDFPFD